MFVPLLAFFLCQWDGANLDNDFEGGIFFAAAAVVVFDARRVKTQNHSNQSMLSKMKAQSVQSRNDAIW